MCVYMYVYVCMYTYVYMYVYMYLPEDILCAAVELAALTWADSIIASFAVLAT
jgi:hypothetical protein